MHAYLATYPYVRVYIYICINKEVYTYMYNYVYVFFHTLLLTWLVVWNVLYFSIYWEQQSHLTNIFQRGRSTTNQLRYFYFYIVTNEIFSG